jgi:serine/threonine protein phosphatase PrpC
MEGPSSPSSEHAHLDPRARDEGLDVGVRVTGVTRCGRGHLENEDQYLIAQLERAMFVRLSGVGNPMSKAGGAHSPQGHVFMVADGVGGRDGGRLASTVAVQSMSAYVLTTMRWSRLTQHESSQRLERGLESALRDAQTRIRLEARRRGIDPRLGTTLTMAYVAWPSLHLLHAGDSRGYVARGGELYQLTRDHTVAQALLDTDANLDRKTVEARWGHVLDNVIGGSTDDLQVDMQRIDLEPGDRVMLCTDGLTAYLEDADLHRQLSEPRPVEESAQTMARMAFDRGGHDDITLVLAQF